MTNRTVVYASLVVHAIGVGAFGQAPQLQPVPSVQQPLNVIAPTIWVRPDYTLGPNDQIMIRAPQTEQINDHPFRIDGDGFITLPLIGRVRASGLTAQALESDLVARLGQYYREPQVFVTIVQFQNEPVIVMGNFKIPGAYPLQGRSLLELLAAVGGLQAHASRRIKVSRRIEYGVIPLPNAVIDSDKKVSTVEIKLEKLTENTNPAEDIRLRPYDVITATRAGRIYVLGEVAKPTPIELDERDSISITEALTEAGGFTQFATRNKVRVLRPVDGSNRRTEIVVNLKRILDGKDVDFMLLPDDLLYVK
jgi:polysaccharide export outer membrane protein